MKEFNNIYNCITKEIQFSEDWKNGTGYLDGATSVALEPGALARSVDDYGRRIVFVGTLVGTGVVFERYKDRSDVIVGNFAPELELFLEEMCLDVTGKLSSSTIEILLGRYAVGDIGDIVGSNIGDRIDLMKKILTS